MKNFSIKWQMRLSIKALFKAIPPVWIFINYLIYIRRGFKLYRKVKKIYGQDAVLLLCPQSGIGDAYLTALCFHTYLEQNQINNGVLLVQEGGGAQIFDLFGISCCMLISEKERIAFQRFFIFMGDDILDVRIMHYLLPVHTSITHVVEGMHALRFHEMFFKIGMKLSTPNVAAPIFQNDETHISQLFTRNHLQKGRTVIIAPYTNTLSSMSWSYWTSLAEQLTELGYCVCTNVDSKNERPIPGTVALTIPFNIAVPLLDFAGIFIGARSGFCEVISTSKCRKIILYPRACPYGLSTVMSFFGFQDSEFFREIEEYEFSDNSENDLDFPIFH